MTNARHLALAPLLLVLLLAAPPGCGPGAPHAAAAAAPAPAAAPPPAVEPTRSWPVADGWKAETLPFPLSFAPALAHRGVEELRFAPGMFEPDRAGYWSYVFVWWLEDQAPQVASALAGELTTYFRGLLGEVATARAAKPGPRPAPFSLDDIGVTLRPHGERGGWTHLQGEATVFDVFGDGRRLVLQLSLAQRTSQTAGRRAVLVLASPAARDQEIWSQLQDVGFAFVARMPP